MYVIMGGTGHVGSATAEALLRRGEAVTIVTREANHAGQWRVKGADVAEADVEDVVSLRAAFRCGRRAFLLNPPADTTMDTDTIERPTVAKILAALEGSGLEKVVAESTGGAQRGDRIGDLSVLWELEEGLRRQSIPAAINRAAYYMSNWDGLLDTVRATCRRILTNGRLTRDAMKMDSQSAVVSKRLQSQPLPSPDGRRT